jgi:hypothetical protein
MVKRTEQETLTTCILVLPFEDSVLVVGGICLLSEMAGSSPANSNKRLPLLLFFCVPVGRRRIRIVEESGVLRERGERSLLAKFPLFLMIF